MRNKQPDRVQAGFTLIEMIVVIAVLGLIVVLLSANGPPRNHWLQTQAAAQQVASAMRLASVRAITSGHDVALSIPAMPPWLAVTRPAAGIIFSPDGSATAGQVILDDAGRRITVTADWLTGRPIINAP